MRTRRAEGVIVEINLPDGKFAYAQILSDPLVGFFGGCYKERQSAETFEGRAFEFCVWVHNDAFKSGRWRKIGSACISTSIDDPWFFKQDAIRKDVTLYQHRTGEEIELAIDKLPLYEAAAVWDPEHIEQRLLDSCEGRPNLFTTSMRKRAVDAWMSKFGS